MSGKKVLIVEDNENLAYGLKNNLEIEGYRVAVVADGRLALDAARENTPDLVVLDLMLPGMDGFRVLRTLREEGFDMPVLILTARDEELDRVRGFRFGADQYLTKPFSVLELLARIESLLRRHVAREPADAAPSLAVIRFGSVEVVPAAREVRRDGAVVALAPKEYELLLALLQREGAVAPRLELIQEVWGYPGDVLTRTVDTHIGELRKKLEEDPVHPKHILTVRKAGYRLQRDLP
ncbi:response regulator transcription factor [Acanthopleuribacter pedis]|uniref:Response regulator transcription factor n=1 Tax=Acanthopleuribacter pedis TaxID=442870 RepID=A0A8J7QF48_9BACT|nr:response regulator transcription factor [Acanthopleuribacter pedis]MBO1323154.1 response regulator transcription factor [Acanthopleuribacter pedis]